jgi:catechol 2,3-dioxygenase-like lactoylglutathione lyase family enzyme
MTSPSLSAAALDATRDLPPVRLSEIVLRTARYAEMTAWYQAVIGIDPFLDTGRVCFRRLHTDYPYTQVLAIFHRPEVSDRPPAVNGLDHIQLRHGSLDELITRYERLREVGIRPGRSMNHGPGTSLYYADPDGNTVELSGPNFDDEATYLAYFDSEAFRANISGIAIDPDEYAARFRGGVPQADLVRIR